MHHLTLNSTVSTPC